MIQFSDLNKLLQKLYNSPEFAYTSNKEAHLINVEADVTQIYLDEENFSFGLTDDDNEILEISKFDGTEDVYSIKLKGANFWLAEHCSALVDIESGHKDSEYVKNFDWDSWNLKGLVFAKKIRQALPEDTYEVWYSTVYEDEEHAGCSIKIQKEN